MRRRNSDNPRDASAAELGGNGPQSAGHRIGPTSRRSRRRMGGGPGVHRAVTCAYIGWFDVGGRPGKDPLGCEGARWMGGGIGLAGSCFVVLLFVSNDLLFGCVYAHACARVRVW